jgi:hypothetical protein
MTIEPQSDSPDERRAERIALLMTCNLLDHQASTKLNALTHIVGEYVRQAV